MHWAVRGFSYDVALSAYLNYSNDIGVKMKSKDFFFMRNSAFNEIYFGNNK
jgi:hypothetical protein